MTVEEFHIIKSDLDHHSKSFQEKKYIEMLQKEEDIQVLNKVCLALKGLQSQLSVPYIFNAIDKVEDVRYTDTFMYSLEELNCKGYLKKIISYFKDDAFGMNKECYDTIQSNLEKGYFTKNEIENAMNFIIDFAENNEVEEQDVFDANKLAFSYRVAYQLLKKYLEHLSLPD